MLGENNRKDYLDNYIGNYIVLLEFFFGFNGATPFFLHVFRGFVEKGWIKIYERN